MSSKTPAQIQFDTSSVYRYPDSGYTLWKICNDYPSTAEHDDYPWLQYDPMKDSEKYLNTIKEYCFEGMINNDFDPWKNKVTLIDYLFFKLSSYVSSALVQKLVQHPMDALWSSWKRAPPWSYH